jgi:hypothetical protein
VRKYVYQRTREVEGKRVPASRFWHYEISFLSPLTGKRHLDRGSTGCHDERAARRWLDRRASELERRDLRGEVVTQEPMRLGDACVRWMEEIGAAKVSAKDFSRDLADLCRLIGEDVLLKDIDNNTVLNAIRERAAQPKRVFTGRDGAGRPKYAAGSLPTAATLNRQVMEPLRRVMARARDTWLEPIVRMPSWQEIRREEPEGRTREALGNEFERYLAEIREDYRPFVLFYTGSGRRIREVLGMHPDLIDLPQLIYRYRAKHKKRMVWRTATLTRAEAAILSVEMAKAPDGCVWSYERRDGLGRAAITYSGFRPIDEGAKRRAALTDFRRHDWRHDALTKLNRSSNNLAITQLAAGHADIGSTIRYVHANRDDVREAREKAGHLRNRPAGTKNIAK